MISASENSLIGADVFSKQQSLPRTITLTQEQVSKLIDPAPSALPQLSQAARDKNLSEVVQLRNGIMDKSRAATHGITNEIDTWFSALQSDATLSATDMSGLISDALQSYSGSGNSTTLSMDLAVTKGMLNKLVERFVPGEKQADSFREVAKFVADKVKTQDTLLHDLTRQSLDIARQYGDSAGVNQFQQQLDLLSRGEHETQKERDALFSLTDATDSSAGWLSGFRQMVSQSSDSDFFKSISYDHIAQLGSHIAQFVHKAQHADPGFSLS
ncbi:hypothetical protein CKF43_16785 [Pantoea graminicola]|uniref:hypothetical protein n=1 Tax=Pantoea sp. ARC607 TaxID=2027922 RepID=UPI000DA808F9|nr:hypothetical protein [Pantoea sp. ARC607]PZL91717.1 hypothetical protein CKF43_16785 [Pantoea sp. ARC607]